MNISRKLLLIPLLAIILLTSTFVLSIYISSYLKEKIGSIYLYQFVPMTELKNVYDNYDDLVFNSLTQYSEAKIERQDLLHNLILARENGEATLAEYQQMSFEGEEAELVSELVSHIEQANITLVGLYDELSTSTPDEIEIQRLIQNSHIAISPAMDAASKLFDYQVTIIKNAYYNSKTFSDEVITWYHFTSIFSILLILVISYFIINRITSSLRSFIRKINVISNKLDLTIRTELKGKDELSHLSHQINTMLDSFEHVLNEVIQSSSNTTSSIDVISLQSQQNVDALIKHTAQTQQVVTAMIEMNSTANFVAESTAKAALYTENTTKNANEAKKVVEVAGSNMKALHQEVNTTSKNIGDMNNNTNKISKVLGEIGDIAEQTNLLALNAAIEAARAGEGGRGFSVVADEVRALAARTQSCTKKISHILLALQKSAEQSVEMMGTTLQSSTTTMESMQQIINVLDQINQAIFEVHGLNKEITTAAEEQSIVLKDVNHNMTSISDMAYQLESNSTKTLELTKQLTLSNQEMEKVVQQFTLNPPKSKSVELSQ